LRSTVSTLDTRDGHERRQLSFLGAGGRLRGFHPQGTVACVLRPEVDSSDR